MKKETTKETIKKTILEHVLVPKHEIMNKEEIALVLEKYGAELDQLPKIMEADPVIEAIGAKKGNVLKIIRQSPTAGESIYYRVVI